MYKNIKIVAQLYFAGQQFDAIDLAPVDLASVDDNGQSIKDFAPCLDSWRCVQRWSTGHYIDEENGKWITECCAPFLVRLPVGQYAIAYTAPRDVSYEIKDELLEEEPADLNDVVWSTEDILKREA